LEISEFQEGDLFRSFENFEKNSDFDVLVFYMEENLTMV
jgi:hypothetical protein